MPFEVTADGEFHEHEIDMSSESTWDGTIVALRLDPVELGDSDIEIDRIWFSSPG